MDPELFEAAKCGDVATLQRLYAEDPNLVQSSTPNGNTALHLAVIFQQEEFAKEMCSKCPFLLKNANRDRSTPLLLAAAAGLDAIVVFVIDLLGSPASHAGDVEEGNGALKTLLMATNQVGNNAMHEALRNSHGGVALELLRAEPELAGVVNKNGESLLYMACYRSLADVVVELLRLPTASHEGPNGETALHAAVSVGHSGLVKKLLKGRPGIEKEVAKTRGIPFHYAIDCHKLAIVRLLLEQDASLAYLVDEHGNPPIVSAALKGLLGIANEIVRRCPDAALMVDKNGSNALHIAADKGYVPVVRYILRSPELQGLINQPNYDGDVPLHLATRECNVMTLRALLADKRLDRAAVNNLGKTAVDVFCSDVEPTWTIKWLGTHWRLGRAFRKDRRLAPIRRQPEKRFKIKALEQLESASRTYTTNTALVAVLMATVTFAAAFTVPGGYDSNPGVGQGLPNLARKAAFKAFLISDTVAMCTSLCVAYFSIAVWEDYDFLFRYASFTRTLMWWAFTAMLVAFSTGLFTVVAPTSLWIAVFICVLSCILPLIYRRKLGVWVFRMKKLGVMVSDRTRI